MKKNILLVLLLVLIFNFLSVVDVEAQFDWHVRETDNFIIFYPTGYELQAQQTLYYLETYLSRVQEITGNYRNFKTRVVIQDTGILTNGYADGVSNKISVYTEDPTLLSDFSTYENWFRLVSVHELTHIRQMTNYSGTAETLSKVFGNPWSPNLYVPNWIIEGITVYNESQLSPYEGRMNDGYVDALLAAKIKADKFPSPLEANYTHQYYPRGQFYWYGGAFFSYIAKIYSEEQIAEFFNIHGTQYWVPLTGDLPFLGIDRAAKKVFGKDFQDLFIEWELYEQERLKSWKIDGEEVIAVHRGSIGSLTMYDNKIYYIKLQDIYPGAGNWYDLSTSLWEFDPKTTQERRLKEFVSSEGGTQIHIQDGKIYYSLLERSKGFANVDSLGFGYVGVLHSYDLKSGKTQKLFSDDFKAFLVLENGDILYSIDNKQQFGSEIWKFDGVKKEKLGFVKEIINEMASYKDQLIVVSKDMFGSWSINLLNPKTFELEPLIATPWAEKSIHVLGDKLYYSANYNSQFALFEYDLISKDIQRLTEDGYAIKGVPVNEDMYFVSILAEGEGIFKKERTGSNYNLPLGEHIKPLTVDIQRVWNEAIEKEDALLANLSYLLQPNLRLFPVLLAGSDALGLNQYSVNYNNITITSKMFKPMVINLFSSPFGNYPYSSLRLNYPVYQSFEKSLISDIIFRDLNKIQMELRGQVRYPRQYINYMVGHMVPNNNTYFQLSYRYCFADGNIYVGETINLNGDNYLSIPEFAGSIFEVELTKKLFELRKGHWNSTLFVGDVYGSLSTSHLYYPEHGYSQIYRLALQFEMGIGYRNHFVPTIGVSLNDGKISPEFNLNLRF